MMLNDALMVSVDPGYDGFKVYTKINGIEKKLYYKSRYELANDDLNSNNTVHFVYNNKHYLVGEGATMNYMDLDKTKDETYKILIYRALSELSNYMGKRFILVTNYPLNFYSSEKDKFSRYLQSDFVETELNGERKVFGIDDVLVLPQCAVAPFAGDATQYENKICGWVDLGGRTMNAAILNNLNVQRDSILTEDLGWFYLQTDIKNALYSIGMTVRDYQIPYIIQNGTKTRKEESKTLVANVMDKHAQKVRNALAKNNWDIDGLDVEFIGGTSTILKEYLCKYIPHSTFNDDIYTNAKGMYEVGCITYGE